MKKKILTLLFFIGGFLVIGQAQANTCNTRVAGRIYSCTLATNFGAPGTTFNATLLFSGDGQAASYAGSGFTLGCSCESKGSFKRPKFEVSKEFRCVGYIFGSPTFSVDFSGKANKKGTKINKGHVATRFGESGVFKCLEGPVPPSGPVSSSPASFSSNSINPN